MPIVENIIKRGFKLRPRLSILNTTPIFQQEKTLKRLLRKASETAFGNYYDFKQILKSDEAVAAFQQHVPIFDYNSIYQQWWHRTLEQEANVCWPGKIKYFALSSGTSGAPSKHIPVTADIIRANRRASLRMFWYLPNFNVEPTIYSKSMMLLGGSTDLQDRGGYYFGDLSGINASQVPFWFRPFYKPGVKIAAVKDWHQRITEIAKNAPKWDIGIVGGIPSWVQLMMERIVAYHGVETIHDIWPNLSVYVTGGIAFEPYRPSFERLTRQPLNIMDTYLASEGFVAIQTRPDTHAMMMLLNNGIFFEFIPFNDTNFDEMGNLKGTPETLTISEVEENKDYALLLSTCAGTWRYLLGDTVRFTNLARSEIIITGRTQHFLSICGEHLSVANMTRAIEVVSSKMGLDIREFTVHGVEKDTFFAHKWYLACVTEGVDSEKVAALLDETLKSLNDDYAIERSAVLKDVMVELVPLELFYKWHEKKGKLGGQNKFPRVLKKNQIAEWEAFLMAENGH